MNNALIQFATLNKIPYVSAGKFVVPAGGLYP